MDLLTDTLTPPADSSPAPVTGQAVLDGLNAAERLSWEQTGDIPARPPADAPADSSPAPSGEQTASTEAIKQPVSEAGTPPEKKGKGAESRKPELHAEIQALLEQRRAIRDELAQLQRQRTPQTQADAQPASSPVSDGAPRLKDFTSQIGVTYETYEDATEAWARADQAHQSAQAHRATVEVARAQEQQSAVNGFHRQMADARQADPQFDAGVSPSVMNLRPLFAEPPGTPRRPEHDLAEGILVSPKAPQLVRRLSDHPDEFAALLRSPNPFVLYRELGRIEASLSTAVPPPVDPAPKSLSSAPPPPVTLGTKPSVAPEAWRDAVARGDFSAYEREMNGRSA